MAVLVTGTVFLTKKDLKKKDVYKKAGIALVVLGSLGVLVLLPSLFLTLNLEATHINTL